MTIKEKLHREMHIQFDEVKLIIKEDSDYPHYKCKNDEYPEGCELLYLTWIEQMGFVKGDYSFESLKVMNMNESSAVYEKDDDEQVRLENEIYDIINHNLSLRKELGKFKIR